MDIATAKLTHAFSDALQVSETVRYGDYVFGSFITEPHSPSRPPRERRRPAILVQRDRPSASGVLRTVMSDVQITYQAQTGPLSHTLMAGLEIDREDLHQQRYANQISLIAPMPLLAPNPDEPFPGRQTTDHLGADTSTQTASGLIGDTIDIGKQWSLTAAVRLDRFQARYDEADWRHPSAHMDLSPRPVCRWSTSRPRT